MKIQKNKGMTYVELIVVLSIFSIMTSIVLFNYGEFQAKVDIRNLASDIALKIVEAQKSALSGKLPTQATGATWKPSYGVYLNISTPTEFIYTSNLKKSVNGNEPGVIIGIMNYPRFPLERKTLEQKAEEIALLCKERFKQNKISIVYPDRTVMFETPEENK